MSEHFLKIGVVADVREYVRKLVNQSAFCKVGVAVAVSE